MLGASNLRAGERISLRGGARNNRKDTRTMSAKMFRIVLGTSVAVPALAVFLGLGSAAAAEQSSHPHHIRHAHYRYPGGFAPGIYAYAPGYGAGSCYLHMNCGLPGGHPRSDYHKVGNGDHGNDSGNGG